MSCECEDDASSKEEEVRTTKELTTDEIDRLDVLLHEVALIGQVLHNYGLLSSENVSEIKTLKLSQRMQELVVINFLSLESQFMRYCVRIALNTAEITPLDETRNFSTANLTVSTSSREVWTDPFSR